MDFPWSQPSSYWGTPFMEPPGVSSAAWTPFSTLEWLVRIKEEEHGWFTAGFLVEFHGFSMGFSWILVDVQGIVVDISWILVDFQWMLMDISGEEWWFNGDSMVILNIHGDFARSNFEPPTYGKWLWPDRVSVDISRHYVDYWFGGFKAFKSIWILLILTIFFGFKTFF